MKTKTDKRPKDVNELAKYLVSETTGEHNDPVQPPSKEQISALMATLGRKGGKIGGKRRLETMTAQKRKAVARKAAEARWNRKVR